LPSVFALTNHSCCHYIVSVFGGDQVGCFEKDGCTISERQIFPCWFCSQGIVYGFLYVRGTSVGVFCDYFGMGGGVVLCED
jgi:hypothetical protein